MRTIRPSIGRLGCRQLRILPVLQTRNGSSAARGSSKTPSEPATASLSPRWLSDVKRRVGKCVMFGLKSHQTNSAGTILQEIANDWRELVAGSEGYLTGSDRRGLFRQEVVWGEMDSMTSLAQHVGAKSHTGHVNNVMYNRYAESARINWAQKYAMHVDPTHKQEWSQLWTPKGVGLILRSMKTDFKFPMTWPDHISVYHKLASEPTSSTNSFVLDVLILSELHQRPAARCVEDIVVYDYKAGKKTPLPPFMVESFRQTWKLQEAAKKANSDRVTSLLDRVTSLEKETWDRADAVEDLGSARA